MLMRQALMATTRLVANALRNEVSSHSSWYQRVVSPVGSKLLVQLSPMLPIINKAIGSSR